MAVAALHHGVVAGAHQVLVVLAVAQTAYTQLAEPVHQAKVLLVVA